MKYALAALLLVAVCVCGCTVTPRTVRPETPGFSETGHADSGFVGFDENGNGIITASKREEFNALVRKYGGLFLVPLVEDHGIASRPDGRFTITPEALVNFQTMKRWRLNGR